MDGQELYNLHEAYLEVYDEGYKPFPKGKVDKRMISKALRAAGNQFSSVWGDQNKSFENQEKANKLASQASKMAQISTEKDKENKSRIRKKKNKIEVERRRNSKRLDDIAKKQRAEYDVERKKKGLEEGYKERPINKMVKKAMDIVNRPEYDGNSEDVWRHNQILKHTTKKKGGGKQRKKAQHNIDKYWARLDREDELEEQVDLYDIILSHLLDEGYAETLEAAEAMMVNMSEEWRYSILEAKKEFPHKKVDRQVYDAMDSGETAGDEGDSAKMKRDYGRADRMRSVAAKHGGKKRD